MMRRIRRALAARLHARLMRRVADRRPPDFIIGGAEDPYLRRWWVIPRNGVFNIYLHHFLRSDDDRALHDHPWWNVSLLLDGIYLEHTLRGVFVRVPGGFYFRRGGTAHRVALIDDDMVPARPMPVWTLFITGPRYRQWGFLCPQGWRHWKEFTAGKNGERVGKGCD